MSIKLWHTLVYGIILLATIFTIAVGEFDFWSGFTYAGVAVLWFFFGKKLLNG